MQIAGKEIKDECYKCGNILECELFRQGHGIKQERENVAKMIECQMKHREEREKCWKENRSYIIQPKLGETQFTLE